MPSLNSEIQADILRACLHREEEGGEADAAFFASFLHRPEEEIVRALAGLVSGGLMEEGGALSEPGRRQALSLTRAHRLLESYLQTRDGMPLEEVHGEADRLEHRVSPLEIEKLADALIRLYYERHQLENTGLLEEPNRAEGAAVL
jgi:DtxR family Mn-dependent transcriptional regulator